MSTTAKEILVNTDQEDHSNDPSITSLREAIIEANKSEHNGTKVYINFRKKESNKPWHILPDSPLPAITHPNIYFNHSYPKNITIDGNTASKKAGITYSLITVGDYNKINSNEASRPKAFFKNINLINNTAKAGKGNNGGGGGLAAGAGMSILQGDVVLENVVFQNLQAVGGARSQTKAGAKSAYSHWITVDDYDYEVGDHIVFKNSQASGLSGGHGGLPSLLGANIASTGGAGGNAGSPKRGHQHGAPGASGGNGGFGIGGAAGGSGGGGAAFKGTRVCTGILFWEKCKMDPPNTYGNGGAGGKGGIGGFGAGNGANGVHGNNAQKFSTLYPKPANPRGGNWGESGDALGAALAILNPSSNVELINVDFIGNKAESANHKTNNFYVINADTREGQITGTSIYTYPNTTDTNGKDLPLNTLVNNQDHYTKVTTAASKEKLSNIHEATSFNRNDNLAKIRDTAIAHRTGHADITTIRVEKPASTLRPINIDSSALENSINDIYKRIIPVEDEKTIKNRFKERILSAVKSAALGGYSSYSKAGDLFKASQAKYTAADQSSAIKIGAGLAGVGMLFSIWEAHDAYKNELEQNKKNLNELNHLQKEDRAVTADPIDIGQSRTVVTVKNFTIGEDTIYLDDYWSNDPDSFTPIIRNGTGIEGDRRVETFEIHLKTSSNNPTKIAEVQLDPESVKKLNSALQTDAIGYIEALLKPNIENQQWEIGTTLTDADRIEQSSNHYTGGPAAEVVVLNRPNFNNLARSWSTTTFNYNDSITGSKGSDEISTNGGNDFIEPSYGKDTINGGESIDWINYADLKEPIQAIGSLVENNLMQKVNSITVNNAANTNRENILDTTLENVEVISSFGASNFDFSAAPAPNPLTLPGTSDELPGFYAMRGGSGSIVKGSPFDDRIIISFMEDENSTDYTNSEKHENTNSKIKYLKQLSIITGNGGNDQLNFAFSDQAPELIIANANNNGEYKDFKAVVNKTTNTVIALFKGIDPSQVKAIHEAEGKPTDPVTITSDSFQYTFEKTSADEILATTNIEITNQIEFDVDDEGVFIQGGDLEKPIQLTNAPLKALYGHRGKDSLIGSPNADMLIGRKGNDQLAGKSGDDIFIGGAGRNQIKPGSGHDQIHLHRHGVQIIHGFNVRRDSLVMPRNFRDSLLDFSNSKITYNNQLIAKIVDS